MQALGVVTGEGGKQLGLPARRSVPCTLNGESPFLILSNPFALLYRSLVRLFVQITYTLSLRTIYDEPYHSRFHLFRKLARCVQLPCTGSSSMLLPPILGVMV